MTTVKNKNYIHFIVIKIITENIFLFVANLFLSSEMKNCPTKNCCTSLNQSLELSEQYLIKKWTFRITKCIDRIMQSVYNETESKSHDVRSTHCYGKEYFARESRSRIYIYNACACIQDTNHPRERGQAFSLSVERGKFTRYVRSF